MKTKNPSPRSETQNLAVRYGEIGISAVAAAMRYQARARLEEAPAQRPLEEVAPEVSA